MTLQSCRRNRIGLLGEQKSKSLLLLLLVVLVVVVVVAVVVSIFQ